MSAEPIVLYGFQISHYVEKVRWAMDYCGIAYREVRWTPMYSIADISTTSILAPILMPPTHPLYSCDTFVDRLAVHAKQFEHHPSYHWMRRIYDQYRSGTA